MNSNGSFTPEVQSQSLILDNNPFNFQKKVFPLPSLFSTTSLTWISYFRKDLYLSALCSTNKPSTSYKLSSLDLCDQDNNFLQKWRTENALELLPFAESSIFKHLHNDIGNIDETEFMRVLGGSLNDHRLVWALVDRFFSSETYIVLPFVNKNDFLKSVEKLIGKRSGKTIQLQLKTTYDLAIIGILLVIMRISSNSLYNFGKQRYTYATLAADDILYIIDHETSKDITKLLTKIYKELEKLSFESTSIEMFEFFLLYEFFGIFDPENCDCVKTASSFNLSFLLNYAIQCSLHIDPDEFIDECLFQNQQDKNLIRRLWYGLVNLDSHQYLMIGNPRIIQDSIYNTKLPSTDPDKVVSDAELLLNLSVSDHVQFYKDHMFPLLDPVLSMNPSASFSKIQIKLDELKEYIKTLKTLEEIEASAHDTIADRYDNAKSFLFLIESTSLHHMISYHFFIQYIKENRNPMKAFDYFMECMDSFHTIFNSTMLFTDPMISRYNFQKSFGCGTLVFPKVEATLHKTNLILFTILGRARADILIKDPLSVEKRKIFNDIFVVLDKLVRYMLKIYLKTGNLYYHTWIISKVQGIMLGQIVHSAKNGINSTVIESRYIDIITKYRDYDPGFKAFNIQQLQAIFDKLTLISETCDYGNNPLYSHHAPVFEVSAPACTEIILQNDRKWLTRMVNEFNLPSTTTIPNNNDDNETPRKKQKSENLRVVRPKTSPSNEISQDDNSDTISEVSSIADGDKSVLMGDLGSLLNANVDLGGDGFEFLRTVKYFFHNEGDEYAIL